MQHEPLTSGAAWRITDAMTRGPHYALAGHVGWADGLGDSGAWRVAEVLAFEGCSTPPRSWVRL